MAFPSSPTINELYTTQLGTVYKYNATGARWEINSQTIVGATGVQGIQGPTGIQGIQGPTGLMGPTGVRGPTGIQGNVGPAGHTGIQGAQGYTGLGFTGLMGPTGLNGPTGPSAGPMGATGLMGPTGISITDFPVYLYTTGANYNVSYTGPGWVTVPELSFTNSNRQYLIEGFLSFSAESASYTGILETTTSYGFTGSNLSSPFQIRIINTNGYDTSGELRSYSFYGYTGNAFGNSNITTNIYPNKLGPLRTFSESHWAGNLWKFVSTSKLEGIVSFTGSSSFNFIFGDYYNASFDRIILLPGSWLRYKPV